MWGIPIKKGKRTSVSIHHHGVDIKVISYSEEEDAPVVLASHGKRTAIATGLVTVGVAVATAMCLYPWRYIVYIYKILLILILKSLFTLQIYRQAHFIKGCSNCETRNTRSLHQISSIQRISNRLIILQTKGIYRRWKDRHRRCWCQGKFLPYLFGC